MCPTSSEIFSTGTPLSESSETKLCRSSRGVQSSGLRPADSTTSRNARRTLPGFSSVPTREANCLDPAGRRVRVSRDTLDRWIRAWRRGGFDALVPDPRQSSPRLPVEVIEMAVALKRENPTRTAAQVRRILRAQMGWSPGERTLQRHFAEDPQIAAVLGALAAGGPGSEAVFGRFEADRPNELWTGDALHGPRIGGRKTYLFAFLDDHSRAIVGTGSGSPRTPSAWPPRCDPRSPREGSPTRSMSIMPTSALCRLR